MATIFGSDPLAFFGAIAALIFLGFLGNVIFSRMRVNDTLILIGVGVLLGPVFRVIEPASLATASAIIGPLALILILFDGGLALKFRDLASGLASAALLSVAGFVLTMGMVGAVTAWALDVPLMTGLVLGAILGGTSALVVMPALEHMKTERKTATTLGLESALTDVLVVVVAFTLITVVSLGQGPQAQEITSKLIITFSMSIFIGVAAGFLWLWLVPHVKDKPFGYMLTLGVMFALYVIVEWLLQDVSSGGGPLAVLAFGVLLGNSTNLGRSMGQRVGAEFGTGMKKFQGEISFLVRTFFFIYLGVLVQPDLLADPYTLALGAVLFIVMAGARYLAVVITTMRPRLSGDAKILWVMMPRGLAAAVLAAVPMQEGIPGTGRFIALAFMILVLTNLSSTVGAFVLERMPPSDPSTRASRRQAKRAAKAAAKARPSGKKSGSKGDDKDETLEFKDAEPTRKKARDRPRRKE